MKTAGRKNQQRCVKLAASERKARTILLNAVGWTARKTPAEGEVFFP